MYGYSSDGGTRRERVGAFPLTPERRLLPGIGPGSWRARGLTRAVTEVPGADVAA
ncbi:hypothetical protein [Nonomuraea sp. KM88]|uniref:hypothetical protein n=1 Tax=Nonomuraea sp. KM88 TaxID=3457427 RepID=UPI003FCC4B8F